jgi:Uncharacterized protein conserved in bacteria (DUF2213)
VKRSKLVTNEDEVPAGLLQRFTCNLLPSQCRYEQLEGREHLVVPMVILTEGVHAGSDGPLYYPKDELAKTPAVWNHKPVVVYHPQLNGAGISACDPAILNSRKVGVMLNTRFEKGKLKSEAWIEKSRAELIDVRIMEAVNNNTMMELSTGVYVDAEKATGKWKSEDYTAIARNYRPDHLALLPDKVGACSISDGAGFLRNQERKVNDHRDQPVSNEMSFSNLRDALSKALRVKFPPPTMAKGDSGPVPFPMDGPWVEDVYTTFVVYSQKNKKFKLGYTSNGTTVTLGKEDPVEVQQVTEYRTLAGAFVGNLQQPITKEKHIMDKNQRVNAIITANIGWAEDDRDKLMAFNDVQVEAIHNAFPPTRPPAAGAPQAQPPQAPPQTATGSATIAVTGPLTHAAGSNQPPQQAPGYPPQMQQMQAPGKPTTVEEYVTNAPKDIQDVLRNSVAMHNEEKQRLVAVITANKNNTFTKEDLSNRPLGELKCLAALAGGMEAAQRPANYGGMAPVPTGNAAATEECLQLPTMNFEKEKKAA